MLKASGVGRTGADTSARGLTDENKCNRDPGNLVFCVEHF